MNIVITDGISELYEELEKTEKKFEEVMCPPFRNVFENIDDLQEYNRQMHNYLEYRNKSINPK